MAQVETTTLTLTTETREFLSSKVASGNYSSEEEVITEALENFRADAEEFERWEREVIVPRYEKFLKDPSAGIPLEEFIRKLKARRQFLQKAG